VEADAERSSGGRFVGGVWVFGQTVQYLIEQGADVDALDLGDNTALHWAAMRGHVEILNLLLMNGADKTIRNKQDKVCIDMCQPVWSHSWKYARELLSDA
jgi:ankyrin repeat protein